MDIIAGMLFGTTHAFVIKQLEKLGPSPISCILRSTEIPEADIIGCLQNLLEVKLVHVTDPCRYQGIWSVVDETSIHRVLIDSGLDSEYKSRTNHGILKTTPFKRYTPRKKKRTPTGQTRRSSSLRAIQGLREDMDSGSDKAKST